ncbi:glyoxalase/bleomycin resistance/extradiol dioxygenase family protein [Kitasatospora kifunensis]|uniref:Putative enzyme related to lactoylglutathione lyase n=1 Tax=Kitasatospora kifunensis TaxID=58351 RepID=A0A7W7R5A4_KITKI|nr:glyoxalase/bleomycin resistance/extradiol dioxygenase family protein [Kitasatospora kifunensis]MBB4925550.1 putative enzyme related to lactoylglutathione lyase [Kitasatospora kifunensis]
MDALYPRLLVARFAECFRFYDAVLPELLGAVRQKGDEGGPYANWDVGGQAALVLFDRAALAATVGTGELPPVAPPAQDSAMLVSRVADVDVALAFCLAHGGTLVAAAVDRPEWGPTLRSAHLRDPEGRLIELQSY